MALPAAPSARRVGLGLLDVLLAVVDVELTLRLVLVNSLLNPDATLRCLLPGVQREELVVDTRADHLAMLGVVEALSQ